MPKDTASVEQDFLLAFAHVPPSAIRIPPPAADGVEPSSGNAALDVDDARARGEDVGLRSRLASFPPPSAVLAANTGKRAVQRETGPAAGFTAGALSGGVADMFLSTILPSSLPSKSATTSTSTSAANTHPGAPGRVRMVSSQREGLTLPNMTNNFRRFVSRAGFIFWMMDRVEEVMFWRKPAWTWAWIICWALISFYPRLLLCAPSAAIILILLHQYEKAHPSASNPSSLPTAVPAPKSILSNPLAGSVGASFTATTDPAVHPAARTDVHEAEGKAHGSTVDTEGNVVPAASAGVPESGVDYYMNLQGIQNLMGLVSDVHDAVLPYLAMLSPNLANTVPPPTTFPLSPTHLLMILLPPTLVLPILPAATIPWILLPLGLAPPVFFHPAFAHAALWGQGFLRPARIKAWRAKAERWVLTDRLDDSLADREIREVRVWENERLDPSWKAGPAGEREPPEAAWGARFLRSAERRPWVRVLPRNPTLSLWSEAPAPDAGGKVALAVIPGWSFVPHEEWRVDLAADWDTAECDEAGWVYCDDSWAWVLERPVTRRRQWWRRVYKTS